MEKDTTKREKIMQNKVMQKIIAILLSKNDKNLLIKAFCF